MNLLEKGDILEYGIQKLDHKVLLPSVQTVAFTEYLKTVFLDISEVVGGYTKYTDFYKNNKVISDFFATLKFVKDDCIFRFDADKRMVYMPDVNFTKEQLKKEVFYSIKLGKTYKGIPSAIFFWLDMCFKDNFIPDTYSVALLPDTEFSELASGQLGEPLKLIGMVYGKKFLPLTDERKYVINNGILEFYLAEKDCVVMAPETISSFMAELSDIKLEKGYVSIKGIPLHRYCGKSGVYKNSAFDLVNCL